MVRTPPDRAWGPVAGNRQVVPRTPPAVPDEQTRARYPDESGFVERAGVRVFYEVYGTGEPTILFLPTWTIVHSRIWKLQIPDLARRHRVIVFDPRGNGRSDRPQGVQDYAETEFTDDALAVLDSTGTERAVIVALSMGAHRALLLATDHPERVAGAIFIAPALPIVAGYDRRARLKEFLARAPNDEGWNKYNAKYWRRRYSDFLEFFFGECFSEAHSTKPIEDAVSWGLETDPETLIRSTIRDGLNDRQTVLERASRVRCPVLVIHGTDDGIRDHAEGEELARVTGARFLSIERGGHLPNVRDPVVVNLAIRDFVRRLGDER
jgi:pimeloyl-ACP methyl ester carboxylesterase